jgi:hypothetical protein
MELITGVFTGADMPYLKIRWMQFNGFAGENKTDDSVWFIKTHAPYGTILEETFSANKIFVIVRNPLECIRSFHALICSGKHSLMYDQHYKED